MVYVIRTIVLPDFVMSLSSSSQEILRWETVSCHTPITEDTLIDNISLTLSKGEKIGVVGASGAGKSTFLKLCNNLISPTQGKIYFQQKSLAELNPLQLRQEIVLVLPEAKLLGMTAKQALIYPLELQQVSEGDINTRLISTLEAFSIPDSWLDKTEAQLSSGQRQLIAIARAVIMQPKILLLDEPSSALDHGKAMLLQKILAQVSTNQQILIIVVNHQLEWVKDFATRVLVLKQGKLKQDSTISQVNWQQIKDEFNQYSQNNDLEDFYT